MMAIIDDFGIFNPSIFYMTPSAPLLRLIWDLGGAHAFRDSVAELILSIIIAFHR